MEKSAINRINDRLVIQRSEKNLHECHVRGSRTCGLKRSAKIGQGDLGLPGGVPRFN
jgi:hypothetical protein